MYRFTRILSFAALALTLVLPISGWSATAPFKATAVETNDLTVNGTTTTNDLTVNGVSTVDSISTGSIEVGTAASGIIHRVDTIADLRLITGSPGRSAVQPLGYYEAGDGGGGPVRRWVDGKAVGYYTAETGVEPDDGGSIIVPTGGDGSAAWVTETGGPINVLMFGVAAGNDQSKATVNVTAIRATIAAVQAMAGGGGKVTLPSGIIWINDTIVLPIGVSLQGQGNTWFGSTQLSTTDNTQTVLELSGRNRVSDISIGAITAVGATGSGIKVNLGGHNYIENVHIESVGTGLELYNTIWNTFNNVDVQSASVTGMKISGNAALNQYSNNNTFMACKFRAGAGKGIILNRGVGNTFIGCNIENTVGIGIDIDGQYSGAFLPTSQILNAAGGHSFVNCWLEANGTGGEPSIRIRDDSGTKFDNTNIYSTDTVNKTVRTTGIIDIDYARNTKFSGKIHDFSDTNKYFHLGSMAYLTDISQMDSYDLTAVVDYGINTVYKEIKRTARERLTANQSFNVFAAGVFTGWSHSTPGGSGTITADSSRLLRPQTHSQYSAKFTMAASPAFTVSLTQTHYAMPASTQFYAVIEYMNGSADEDGSPLLLQIYDYTNSAYWDFVARTWGASVKELQLPINRNPDSVSVPFITPGGSANIGLVLAVANPALAGGAVYNIFSAAFQQTRQANPLPAWNAAPSANTWAVGDRVVNTSPTVGQPKAWVCTVAGTPGTWVSEGNL
jgi:hypothetical protein